MDVANLVWIVTGGLSGLGAAVVEALVAKSGYVACLDLNAETGEGGSDRVHNVQCDVGDEDSVKQALKSVKEKWQGRKWGGVVHCGGVGMAGKVRSEYISANRMGFADGRTSL